MSPTISVLLPFHNAAATLDECLVSILAQSMGDFELLAIDDGSEDGSAEVVRRRVRQDARVRLLQPGRRGLVPILNLGLSEARAPLVARMDADDRMRPERLRLQRDYMRRNPDVAAVGSRVHAFPEHMMRLGFREYLRWQDQCLSPEDMAHEIYWEAPLVNPSATLRRALALDLGGYREGPFPEDYEFWLRLVQAGHRIAKLPQVLLDWRQSGQSYSRRDGRFSREAFNRIRTDYLARDPRLNRGRPLVFWGAGRRTRLRSRLLLEAGHRPEAYVDIDPRKIGNRLEGIPVVAPDWLPRHERPLVLCYVARHGARASISADLRARGYARGRDYLMVG